jgi:predicted transcriptional regulator
MAKTPVALRLSDEAVRLLDRLSRTLGVSKTAIVEQAIRAFARASNIKPKDT